MQVDLLNIRLASDITFQFYPDSQGNSSVNSNCNALTFVNLGTTMAYVNRAPIGPGQQLVIVGDLGEVVRTVFSITYTGSGTNSVMVMKKTYM